jgi:hypothetical protein
MQSEPFPFDELIANLDDIDDWLRRRGLQAHDRIRRYRKNIKEMIDLQRRDEHLETLQNITEERRREIFWSYVEAEEFARAVRPLRQVLGDQVGAAPIKRALDGPADLFLETQRSSQGRNFMFELIMGGRLAKGGFVPAFDEGPDIQFQYRGLRVAMQCKRPYSMDGMEETIGKAIDQLKEDGAELSIIAVSVSRLWNAGDPDEIPIVRGPAMGQAYLDMRGRQIADETRRFWKDKLERAGIVFYGYAPVSWQMDNGRFGHAALRAETMCPVMANDVVTKTLLASYAQELGA